MRYHRWTCDWSKRESMHSTCVRCGAKQIYDLPLHLGRVKHYVTPEGRVVRRRPECGPKKGTR